MKPDDAANWARQLAKKYESGLASYPTQPSLAEFLYTVIRQSQLSEILNYLYTKSNALKATDQRVAAQAVNEVAVTFSSAAQLAETRPRLVCLVGSCRFYDAFRKSEYDEEQAGRIVFSLGFFPGEIHGEMVGVASPADKASLDELYLNKVELADEVFVMNVGGVTSVRPPAAK